MRVSTRAGRAVIGTAQIEARDIEAGEELTCNYALFDLDLIEGKYKI
jgi:hypothetical protein